MALTGIIILTFFVVLAAFAPLLTHENPVYATSLASPYSVPGWAKVFPQYQNLPVNTQYFTGGDFKQPSSVGLFDYSPTNGSVSSGIGYNYLWNNRVGPSGVQAESYDLANTGPGSLEISLNAASNGANAAFTMTRNFTYDFSSPQRFRIGLYALTNSSSPLVAIVSMTLSSPAKSYLIMSQQQFNLDNSTWTQIVADSRSALMEFLVSPSNTLANIAGIILNLKGSYTLSMSIGIQGIPSGHTSIYISDAMFFVFGSAYGVLGTDSEGRSVWSQFLYGARVSLEVGFFAALIVILLASVIGITSAYYGGWVDETLMRFNDLMLTIPILPLLLVLILIVDISRVQINIDELVVFLIGFLGWEVYARVIRSQVLAVKERAFVSAAKTLGVKPRTIIRRHILPNIMGLIYALLSQAVPLAILLQAALSFLGFYDPTVFSWGRMLGEAQSVATVPTYGFVWWWFLPPGIAIALVSVSFIFIGNALDEMFNPKLVR
jgi:peptide/nickel transport system permease protein